MGAFSSALHHSEMSFPVRGVSLPTCLSLGSIRGLGARRAKQTEMESLQETQHFPLASPAVFVTFLPSLCSHLLWQPSLPARAEVLSLANVLRGKKGLGSMLPALERGWEASQLPVTCLTGLRIPALRYLAASRPSSAVWFLVEALLYESACL